MRVPIRFVLTGLALFLAGGARAQGPNPLDYIRADRWADAQAEAARFADPVAEKLVLYFRLRAPGAATAAEIADFMQRNPDWPAQAILERRREEAIASDPDDAAVLAQCTPTPALAAAMLRCADATANAGHVADADAIARRAWVDSITTANDEAAFLRRWSGIVTADDQWARFQRLAWLSDSSAAARQVARLDPAYQAAAEARLAAKRDDPRTEALVAALPPALRDDPGLTLDRARSMRRTDHDAEAAALLIRTPDAGNLPAFWSERNLLARKLLREGDAKTAYAVVVANRQTAEEPRADAAFLAGFIALRMLHDPAAAARHFSVLAESHSIITQGRAHYWLGRALAAEGKDPKPEYEKAATWPTTFYGQLAILALGERPAVRIAKLHDPTWTRDAALAFTEHEVLRAAAWLIAWGDPSRARVFLTRMDELAPIPAERALTATFALQAGMPDGAVFVARRMGRDGLALPHAGWPTPYDPAAPPDPAFSLAIMRQESSFEIGALSPSGARGLMQLMPPTAQAVARELGIQISVPALTINAGENIRLGTAYLQEMLTHFDNSLPLAAAAYNAGPARVGQWLNENGDPRTGPVDMVDWIELIPVGETRNYVQRVTENVVMYRAALHDPAPILTNTPWTR
ncbi:lytic transglycosylase domain-containing protein [Acidisphaera sp. S103]|uniref:lytic transglycosylase domain-containing protein n=1 Tax=Acidisphaera sp. S103 TaxID=1747223 RepID=UPI00131DE764|nr:lytic transglycosylase domain-containing protein [Acidisphaera sp. S103]